MSAIGSNISVRSAYAGDYSAATTYQAGQIVGYSGGMYLCLAGPVTNSPPAVGASSGTWGLLASSGATGNNVTRTVSASTTAVANDFINVNATSGVVTITLPTSPAADTVVVVKKTDASTNAVNVSAAALVDGQANIQLTLQYQSVTVQYNGTWFIKSAGRTDPGVVPVGGAINAVLAKSAATDFALKWVAGGGLVGVTSQSTTPYTAVAGDFVLMSASSGARTVNLPSAPANNDTVAVRKDDSSANAVAVVAGAKFIDANNIGSTTLSVPYETVVLQYSTVGTIWNIRAEHNRPFVRNRVVTTTTLAVARDFVLADATSGAFTVTLPTLALSRESDVISVKKTDVTGNLVTIAVNSQLIDGASTPYYLSAPGQSVTFTYNALAGSWNVRAVSGASLGPSITASKTAAYTAVPNELVLGNATSGAFTVSLPVSPALGASVVVKKTDASANAVSVAWAGGAATIDGDTTPYALTLQGQAGTFQYDGTGWQIRDTVTKLDATLSNLITPTYLSTAWYDRRHYTPGASNVNMQSAAATVNTIYYLPWYSFAALPIDRLSWLNGTVAPTAGSAVRFGAYTSVAGVPTNLIFDAGSVTLTTSASVLGGSVVATGTLPKGWCFIAMSVNSTGTPGSVMGTPAACPMIVPNSGLANASATWQQLVYGTAVAYWTAAGNSGVALTATATGATAVLATNAVVPNVVVRAL